MAKVKYPGPFAAVDVVLGPLRRPVRVERGGTVSCTSDEAAQLLAQGWEAGEAPRPPEKKSNEKKKDGEG